MQIVNEFGNYTRLVATGTLSIGTSGGKIAILGISQGRSNGTAVGVQIWEGQVTGNTTIMGLCTLPANAFTRFPVYCSGGATFNFVACEAPDITLYWNPLG